MHNPSAVRNVDKRTTAMHKVWFRLRVRFGNNRHAAAGSDPER